MGFISTSLGIVLCSALWAWAFLTVLLACVCLSFRSRQSFSVLSFFGLLKQQVLYFWVKDPCLGLGVHPQSSISHSWVLAVPGQECGLLDYGYGVLSPIYHMAWIWFSFNWNSCWRLLIITLAVTSSFNCQKNPCFCADVLHPWQPRVCELFISNVDAAQGVISTEILQNHQHITASDCQHFQCQLA